MYLSLPSRTIVAAASVDDSNRGRQNRSRAGLPRQRTPAVDRNDHRSHGSNNSTSTVAGAASLHTASITQPSEFAMSMNVLNRHRALVLDSAYRPIEIVNWQRALCMHILDKADVLEYYEQTVNSVKEQFFLPAVMRARWYSGNTSRLSRVTLNRRNVMLRDNFTCQYCFKGKDLTIDHVVAQSRGGENTWTNLVTACSTCNTKKGNKTLKELKWKLKKQPKEPSPYEINVVLSAAMGSSGSHKELPAEWQNYLFTSQGDGM